MVVWDMALTAHESLENLDFSGVEHCVRLGRAEGKVVVFLVGRPISTFHQLDKGAMHVAAVSLAESGVCQAKTIAKAFGITQTHLSRLRGQYRRNGARGIVASKRGPKMPWRVTPEVVAQIQALHKQGLKQMAIVARVGVSQGSVSRVLNASTAEQLDLLDDEAAVEVPEESSVTEPEVRQAEPSGQDIGESGDADADATVPATAVIAREEAEEPTVPAIPNEPSETELGEPAVTACEGEPHGRTGRTEETPVKLEGRDLLPSEPRTIVGAGAMLLHPVLNALGVVQAFVAAGARLGPWRLFDLSGIVGILAMGFGLGIRNVERMKLAQRLDLGMIAGLPVAPEVRTIRRKLEELAGTTEPVAFTRELARSLVRFEPVWESVYFVDGHFEEYCGKMPVPKGWHPRAKRPARGRTDTWVHDVKGRPLFFVTSEINEGLTKAMPRVVEEILAVAGENADVQLFFDRGGFSQELFAALTDRNVGFTTWVKGTPTNYQEPAPEEFRKRWYSFEGKRRHFELAEGELALGPYIYRLIILRDKGRLIPIVTNNWTDPAPKLVLILKLRWRQENSFKDLVENYWIDDIVEYGGREESDPTEMRNPRRTELRQALDAVRQERLELEAALGRLHIDEGTLQAEAQTSPETLAEKRKELLVREQELEEELGSTPARLPRNEVDPEAVRAVLSTTKRTLVKGIKNVVHNAEHWLARRFLAHFGDPDEYRSVLRSLLQLPGTLHYRGEDGHVTVRLAAPDTPRVARALESLLRELNDSNPRTLDGRWAIRYELDGLES